MKTFLENLKTELTRRNFSSKDIEEILLDHEEMIKEAKEEGLSDEDIEEKFGDPKSLAQDLMDSRNQPLDDSPVSLEGYDLLESFPALDTEFDVKISLVNDDVDYYVHDKETIEVYYKDIKKTDNYRCKFDGKVFSLEEKKKLGLMFGVRMKSGQFLIKVPKNVKSKNVEWKFVSGDLLVKAIDTEQLNISTVSGDIRIENGRTDTMKVSLVSGDASIHNFQIQGDAFINTVSGDITFRSVEGNYVDFKTVSGDCEGIEFYPKSVKLSSVSGDISISNKNTDHKIEVLGKKAISGSISINN